MVLRMKFPAGLRLGLLAVAIAGVLSGTAASRAYAHEHDTMPMDQGPRAPVPTDSIYNSDAAWTDHDGKRVTLKSLGGKPQIVAMFYTTCQYVCPLIVDEMKHVERELGPEARSQVGFALFSFDPERDSPTVLKAYAAKRELDTHRWRLYTANSGDVLELAALLGVRFRKEPDGEFSHSTIITVLDRQGVIRYQMLGLNQDRGPLLKAVRAALQN